LKREEILEHEYRMKHKNGEWKWIQSKELIFSKKEDNSSLQIFGIAVDITERKEAEEKMKHLNEDLEQRVIERTKELQETNKELESFSYSVSHDLRAPLRAIDGFSRALQEEYESKFDEQGLDYLSRIRSATNRMGQLIDDMLKLSRITRHVLHKENVNVSNLARSVFNELLEEDDTRNIELIIQDEIFINADLHLINIILQNLIGNAIKFTGKIKDAKIEIGKTVKGDKSAIYIKDNGAGFDMKYVDKLFGAFQRLHSGKEFAGTGIGLSIVQRIIHKHGGQIWAEGEIGKGATFYFVFN
jgi:light-regulated signal transduction histidine kinase (bacteriophytochrome)